MVTRLPASPLSALADGEFDLLVVGGGITGACVALDAVGRGLRTALIDRGDWGGGASANCLRIAHGGLRYLQHFDLRRARESIRQRSMWLRSAPHLVEPLPVVVATWENTFPPRALLAGALALNELLSIDRNRGLSAERRLPRARLLSAREVVALVPALEAPGLTGGVVFQDAIMYSPERLVLEVVLAARRAGAACSNHVAMESVEVRNGRVVSVELRDALDGNRVTLRPRWLVNASGSAAPALARQILGRTVPAAPRYSLALNLVTRQAAAGPAFTVIGGAGDPDRVGARGAGRQLFVVPWRGQRLVGTGHLPFTGDAANPELDENDVARFLDEVRHAVPSLGVERADVTGVQWGLLPLDASAGNGDPVRLLKQHRVLDHAHDGVANALSVVSVKFTTARAVARAALDRIIPAHRRSADADAVDRLPLPGFSDVSPSEVLRSLRMGAGRALPDDVAEHLARSYGSRAAQVAAMAADGLGGDCRLSEGAPVIEAQLRFGVREELARTVEDLLWRRTELGGRGLVEPAARAAAERALRLTDSGEEPDAPSPG